MDAILTPQHPIAALAVWAVLGAAPAALLAGWGRMIYFRRCAQDGREEALGGWTLSGARVGATIGMFIGMLRWGSALSAAAGVGLGVFLIMGIVGAIVLHGHQ